MRMQPSTPTALRRSAGLIFLLSLGVLAAAVLPGIYTGVGLDAWSLLRILLGIGILLASLWLFSIAGKIGNAQPAPTAPAQVAPAAPPAAAAKNQSGAEAVLFLSLLQEKGRFVDFLMEDVSAYSNEQVGAAARVVHQGCREVVNEAFSPGPVSPVPESSAITLEAGYDAGEFRVVGKVDGASPLNGKVVHKGWRANHIKLPRRQGNGDVTPNPVIVPAEITV